MARPCSAARLRRVAHPKQTYIITISALEAHSHVEKHDFFLKTDVKNGGRHLSPTFLKSSISKTFISLQSPHFKHIFRPKNTILLKNGSKKWRTPFVTHFIEILDIENLYIPAITAFQAHFHAEKRDFVKKRK